METYLLTSILIVYIRSWILLEALCSDTLCLIFSWRLRECSILIPTLPIPLSRGMLPNLSFMKFFVSKKGRITVFPPRLSWCSVFLVIKCPWFWDFEMINIHDVWNSMIHNCMILITYKWMLSCENTQMRPRRPCQMVNCLWLWMTLFFASCVFWFPIMHMLTFKK